MILILIQNEPWLCIFCTHGRNDRWPVPWGFVFQFSQVNVDEPMFQPFPSEIFFQKFEPFDTYEVPLTLRNNDKV